MVRANNRSSYSSNSRSRDDRGSGRSGYSSGGRSGGGRGGYNSSRRGGRYDDDDREPETYHPILSLFFNLSEGRSPSKINIKRYETRDGASIEDTITLEEWLMLAEKLYYGELRLDGALWESDIREATHTGNIRLTGKQIREWLDREPDEEPAPSKKKTAAKKTTKKTQPATRSRRNYKEDIQEDDEEEEADEVYDIPFDEEATEVDEEDI